MKKRRCSRCRKRKTLSNFYISNTYECKDCYNKRKRDWYKKNPQSRAFTLYKHGAKRRGIKFFLTFAEFMSFWRKPCFYCGSKIRKIGLDRIDNKRGYSFNNVVPACQTCNFMKHRLKLERFLGHIERIWKNKKQWQQAKTQ